MKDIVWYPLSEAVEVSYRLGHNTNHIPDGGLCCQEVYDIAWKALKQMVKLWNDKYIDRMPHFNEIYDSWERSSLDYPFRTLIEWDYIIAKAHLDIAEFYKQHLGRFPSRYEIKASIMQCQIDPNFKFDYNLIHTDENYKINHEGRYRNDKFEFSKVVEIDKCVFCGEPIYIFDKNFDEYILKDAGIITMGFGYGSRRDTDHGKGFIHDLCSAKLDQVFFKKRLKWCDDEYLKYHTIDIEKSEQLKELKTYAPENKASETIEFNDDWDE